MGHGRPLDCMKTGSRRPRRGLAGAAGAAPAPSHGPTARAVGCVDHPRTGRRAGQCHRGRPLDADHGLRGDGVRRILQEPGRWRYLEPDRRRSHGPDAAVLDRDRGRPVTATRVYATARVGLDGSLYRSTDAGASWSFTRLDVLDAVAIDPATPSTLYAVGDRGVLKSSDAVANWTSVQPEPSFCVP